MTNRLVTKAIGKLITPDQTEGFEKPYIEENDYFYTIAILFSRVIGYHVYTNSPLAPYYQYDGPLLKVFVEEDHEFMLMMPFKLFDDLYMEWSMQGAFTYKSN